MCLFSINTQNRAVFEVTHTQTNTLIGVQRPSIALHQTHTHIRNNYTSDSEFPFEHLYSKCWVTADFITVMRMPSSCYSKQTVSRLYIKLSPISQIVGRLRMIWFSEMCARTPELLIEHEQQRTNPARLNRRHMNERPLSRDVCARAACASGVMC